MKKTASIFAVFMLCILLCAVLPIHGEEKIYSSVIRLHVLANSDSEEDQNLKLLVRDSVLRESESLFSGFSTKEEAVQVVNSNLDKLISVAQQTVYDNGYSYPVSIYFDEEKYPTRDYESMCFPSGEYLSLRVCIGEAEGQNWWCVLFPPMCLSAASVENKNSAEDAFVAAGLTPEQYKIITESDETKYKVKFKILEVLEDIKG
jgi:stage II sporulation protein R